MVAQPLKITDGHNFSNRSSSKTCREVAKERLFILKGFEQNSVFVTELLLEQRNVLPIQESAEKKRVKFLFGALYVRKYGVGNKCSLTFIHIRPI